MRIQSSYGYGNSVFDVRREFQNSRSKTKKLIVYFVLSSFIFYVVKFVLKLNSLVFMDIVEKAIRGEPININSDYLINMSQSNKIVAFLFSAYYFMEKNLTTAKEHILIIFEKIPRTIPK
ncbi:hypothetical protein HYH68_16415 [Clostridium botulinum]|uniref:hypothetical protein n=1 Tax=Clostridium botulinum TaxID=1491 RepID=UPI001C9AF8C2|nr:hypothetical protein [Clostridium botulinum]MBY6889377.1 hypothetical protein [Clostridium botulinum]HDI3019230.1 hypothetical protein [Clostridium botulinum]